MTDGDFQAQAAPASDATRLPRLSDLELAAYIDGDLDPMADLAQVSNLDRRLDAHPDQRAFVERVRLVEDSLRADLDRLLDLPLPDHLLALLDIPAEPAPDAGQTPPAGYPDGAASGPVREPDGPRGSERAY